MATRTARGTGVPFVDLERIHAPLKAEILDRLSDLIDRSEFGSGAAVKRFESAFAELCGGAACVGVGSGLDALRLSLEAAGIEPGDEVILPANTFVATFEAVTQAGGLPVPVDITLDDLNIDVAAAERAISPRTRFLLPVHLYGQLADMVGVTALAERHGLAVLEDAAQAIGSSREGRRPGDGTLGAAFSFYPAKNLGAMGDAGAVVSNDAAFVERVRLRREHGQARKYEHTVVGWTSRLDAFQAEVLNVKLAHLDEWSRDRAAAADAYLSLLADVGDIALPPVARDSNPVWHLFVIRTADPDALAAQLASEGIATGRHYPQPPHLSEAYRALGHGPGDFPVTERLAETALSLPIFAGITDAEAEQVATSVRSFFDHG